MRASTTLGLGVATAALVLAAGVPLAIEAISTSSAVIEEVERACIPPGPLRWKGQDELLAMWERVPLASRTLGPFRHALRYQSDGDLRALAAEFLSYRARGQRRWVHAPGPGTEPEGGGVVLSGPLPSWVVSGPRPPTHVASWMLTEAIAAYLGGETARGHQALREAYRFTRVVARGHHSRADLPLVRGGMYARIYLDRALTDLLYRGVLPEEALSGLHDTLREDGHRMPGLHMYVLRDLDFRRAAVELVRKRLGPLSALEPLLWGSPADQLLRIRKGWFLGDLPTSEEVAGMHPVMAHFLPDLESLRHLQRQGREARFTLLDDVAHRRLATMEGVKDHHAQRGRPATS